MDLIDRTRAVCKMTNIYILRLEGGRYYVGKTENVTKRYQQHIEGKGSAWTKKYPPLALVKTIEGASGFDEDRYVKEYMETYGIQNVRGGSYVQIELSDFQKENLKTEIWGSTNKCTQCGRDGHFIKDCYAKKDVTGRKIEYESESEDDDCCYRCGRTGHYSSSCYARTNVEGKWIS